MFGHNPSRTFAYPCPTEIAPDTVANLQLAWFFNTHDVVTATPAVVDGTAYVGDWSGRFYAIDTATARVTMDLRGRDGTQRLRGQHRGERGGHRARRPTQVVLFASGRTLYALDTASGSEVWSLAVGTAATRRLHRDRVVTGRRRREGLRRHRRAQPARPARRRHRGRPAHRRGGLVLRRRTGQPSRMWRRVVVSERRPRSRVWCSQAVATARHRPRVGAITSNRSSRSTWTPVSSAGTIQPHEAEQRRPRLRRARPTSSAPTDGTWSASATRTARTTPSIGTRATSCGRPRPPIPASRRRGSNFSTGGFIGATAYSNGTIAGGTAVGPAPFVHGIDASTGDILWQDDSVRPCTAPLRSRTVSLFQGNNDFTFRAYDLASGDELWQHDLQGVGAGGSAIVGNDISRWRASASPASKAARRTAGSTSSRSRRRARRSPASRSRRPPPARARATGVVLEPTDQPCVGTPCDMFDQGITLRPAPMAWTRRSPSRSTRIRSRCGSAAAGWVRPAQWLQAGSPAAEQGATAFALFASESDDDPTGGLLCIMDADYSCTTDSLPRLTTYNRITLLAVERPDSPLPSRKTVWPTDRHLCRSIHR